MSTVNGADVARVLTGHEQRGDVPFRVVGTASSVLRGIATPASDVDILFAERAGVDDWCAALGRVGEVGNAPRWLADARQYFARVHVHGVDVELSTVEIADDGDTSECFGRGPWEHFDVVTLGPTTAPVVATELRLVTEVVRGRPDRARPLVEHLRAGPCDRALVRRGLVRADVPRDDVARVLAALAGSSES